MANMFTDSSSEGEFNNENSEDLSYGDLTTIPDFLLQRARDLRALRLNHNEITVLPRCIGTFTNVITLDLSNNNLSFLSSEIVHMKNLRTFFVKNNNLTTDDIPKDFGRIQSLEVINFSGNNLHGFPVQFTELSRLRALHLGGNKIVDIPNCIQHLKRLEVLYMGGNSLTEIPAEVGSLDRLTALNLCDNQLQSLPPTLINLRNLQSLSLHNNNISTLPVEIITLDLIELSLRNNPLVVKFVQDMVYKPPSLLEMAGRVMKISNVKYTQQDLPEHLFNYLNSAQRCVNPKCKGVYFSSRVEHVKFVDFCGKYRLPLMQFLCSPKCRSGPGAYPSSSSSDTDTDEEDMHMAREKLRRVLLG